MKHIKRFNENLVEWKQQDLNNAFELLYNYVEQAEELTGENE